MNLFLWICAITVVMLFVYLLLIFYFEKKKQKNKAPVFISILIAEWLICVILCIATVLQGSSIKSSELLLTLPIDEATFQTSDDAQSRYQFTTTNGIDFKISEDDLLDAPVREPAAVEIYQCQTYDGFSWCYLAKNKNIFYKLK